MNKNKYKFEFINNKNRHSAAVNTFNGGFNPFKALFLLK